MNELLTVWQISGAGLGLVISAMLWSYGGRAGTAKAWRRFVSPAVMVATLLTLFAVRSMFRWEMLLLYPIMLASCLGYGGDTLIVKILRRTLFALANIMGGLFLAILLGGNAWNVLILHVGVALFTCYLGIINPVEAAAEEFLVCLLLYTGFIAYPFITVM